jgi:hypothetical protein
MKLIFELINMDKTLPKRRALSSNGKNLEDGL